ncbi:hypothetical protein [Thermococcus sp.]
MPSSTKDLSVDVAKKMYIDRYGISTLTEFNTTLFVRFRNQSPQLVYVKAIIEDANGNWTFDNGSTSKNLGSLDSLGTTNKYVTLKRAVPSTDVEESFTIKFEFYRDSGYTQKVDTLTESIEANIIDFRNSTDWTINLTDFEDGTEQGWTLNLFSITQDASIEANGYSAYYYLTGTTVSKHPSLTKTISVPTTATKAGILFHYGAHMYVWGVEQPAYFNYVCIYVNGSKVYEDYLHIKADRYHEKYVGWYQASIDLTQWKGQDVEVKIELELKLYRTSNMWIKAAIDDVIFAYK